MWVFCGEGENFERDERGAVVLLMVGELVSE